MNSNYPGSRRPAICGAIFCLLTLSGIVSGELKLNPDRPNTSAPPGLPHSHFVAGEQLSYKLSYSGAGHTDFGVLFEGENQSARRPQPAGLVQSIETSVRGRLQVTVVEVTKNNVVLACRLRGTFMKLTANGNDDSADAEKIKRELGRDFFATLNLRGNVVSVRFDAETSGISQNFARTLLAATQFVFPGEPPTRPDQWETQEEDTNGRYIARYRLLPAGMKSPEAGAMTFQKRILRYVSDSERPAATEFRLNSAIIPSGRVTVVLDQRNRRIAAINGTESQVFQVEGKTVGSAQSTVALRLMSRKVSGPVQLSELREGYSLLERTAQAMPLFAPVSKTESEMNIERAELGNDRLEMLLADLAKLSPTPGDQNETRVYLKFKAMVHVHPESAAALGRLLSAAEAKSTTMRVLAGALSAVGSPEAQAALVEAIKARPADWPALSMLIPSLNEADCPTPLAEDAIHELTRSSDPDIASTAQLTLGTMARRLAATSPERAAGIVDSLLGQIDASPSPEATRQLLLALGNAGSLRAGPATIQFTTDPAPELRAAATAALRFIDSEQAGRRLTVILASDTDPDVRLESVIALGFRRLTEELLTAQKQALATDADSKVRLAALRNLWQEHLSFPEVRTLAKRAATNDPSEDIRKAARQLLASGPPEEGLR